MIHDLKVWPEFFERLVDGTKTFEVRKDDRGYQAGDVLILREWHNDRCPEAKYCYDRDCSRRFTGRVIQREVGFIFKQGFGCDLGEYVVMSLLSPDEHETGKPKCYRCDRQSTAGFFKTLQQPGLFWCDDHEPFHPAAKWDEVLGSDS